MTSVALNQFAVALQKESGDSIPIRITEKGAYASLAHETTYTIVLQNDRTVRCDAVLTIDGKSMGTYRIEPRSTHVLHRPLHDEHKFVFLKAGTSEAKAVGINGEASALGLLQVLFKPESPETVRKQIVTTRESFERSKGGLKKGSCAKLSSDSTEQMYKCESRFNEGASTTNLFEHASDTSLYTPGGTAFGTKSSQTFGIVPAITNVDGKNQTTISIRLVVEQALNNGFATAVPPPVSINGTKLETVEA